MLGGINPKQMQAMMKQMGIKQEEFVVERVIFQTAEKNIILEPANVQKITMQGQESYQVTGDARIENKELIISESDITMVAEKANVSKEQAKAALEAAEGDIAEAIMKLS